MKKLEFTASTSAILKQLLGNYVYIIPALNGLEVISKFGMTTSAFQRMRAYVTMNANLPVVAYKVASKADAKAIEADFKNYLKANKLWEVRELTKLSPDALVAIFESWVKTR